MAAYEPGFEPTDSLECCLEKIKGKFFYFDDEKSSFAAMVMEHNTQINLFESKWHNRKYLLSCTNTSVYTDI